MGGREMTDMSRIKKLRKEDETVKRPLGGDITPSSNPPKEVGHKENPYREYWGTSPLEDIKNLINKGKKGGDSQLNFQEFGIPLDQRDKDRTRYQYMGELVKELDAGFHPNETTAFEIFRRGHRLNKTKDTGGHRGKQWKDKKEKYDKDLKEYNIKKDIYDKKRREYDRLREYFDDKEKKTAPDKDGNYDWMYDFKIDIEPQGLV